MRNKKKSTPMHFDDAKWKFSFWINNNLQRRKRKILGMRFFEKQCLILVFTYNNFVNKMIVIYKNHK